MAGRASIQRMSLTPAVRRIRGLTLIELLLFVVILGIALSAMLSVFITATQASADPLIRRQQLAIAESLLREVELMPFTWCDPDDAATATAASAAGCTTAEALGPEAGETRYGPTSYFDNVNDYASFSMTGIRDITNAAVSGLSGYAAAVDVASATLNGIAGGAALKITVTVTAPDGSRLSLQGWRTRFAPNDAY